MSNLKVSKTVPLTNKYGDYLKAVNGHINNDKVVHIITAFNAFTIYRGEDEKLVARYVRFIGESLHIPEVVINEINDISMFSLLYNDPRYNFISDELVSYTPIHNIIGNLSDTSIPYGATEIFSFIRLINKCILFTSSKFKSEVKIVDYSDKVFQDIIINCTTSNLYVKVNVEDETVTVNLDYIQVLFDRKRTLEFNEKGEITLSYQSVDFISTLFGYFFNYVIHTMADSDSKPETCEEDQGE